ncbi:hypothetical protein RhiJN_27737 [Ceratobasidium sp. AG-Ba]|nr:hypothetical protein RhiJN_27722 [Ceratobasidium sp. AG-Ba]QRV99718.1 hypothetical protein RhiJN_27737 [Ceratobasidium sp. AG-Ba]
MVTLSDPNVLSFLSPDGRFLVSCHSLQYISVFNVKTRLPAGQLRFDDVHRGFKHVAWTDSSSFVVVDSKGEVIQVDVMPDLDPLWNPRPKNLASLSIVRPQDQSSGPAGGFCYDSASGFFALGLSDGVQIWGRARERSWTLVDTIPCGHKAHGPYWIPDSMAFINDGQLVIMTRYGIGIWAGAGKDFVWQESGAEDGFTSCVVSPNKRSIACGTSDYIVYIWPVRDERPYLGDSWQKPFVFKIPTGREWLEEADVGATPLNYLDDESILTADPIGTIYVISPQGETKHKFSVGQNYFIRTITAHKSMVYIVAIGPLCTTMLLGYTDDVVVHHRAASGPLEPDPNYSDPCGIFQAVNLKALRIDQTRDA